MILETISDHFICPDLENFIQTTVVDGDFYFGKGVFFFLFILVHEFIKYIFVVILLFPYFLISAYTKYLKSKEKFNKIGDELPDLSMSQKIIKVVTEISTSEKPLVQED